MPEQRKRPMTFSDRMQWQLQHDALVKSKVMKQAKSNKTFLVIHGGKSLNKQLPQHLHRRSNDYDMWAKKPQERMDKMEDSLDKAVGADMFYEESIPMAGSNKRVYRVMSRITNDAVVDYINAPNKKGYYKIMGGVKWETLDHAKKIYRKILNDPTTGKERKRKSQVDLNRILQFEGKLKQANKHQGLFQGKFHFKSTNLKSYNRRY